MSYEKKFNEMLDRVNTLAPALASEIEEERREMQREIKLKYCKLRLPFCVRVKGEEGPWTLPFPAALSWLASWLMLSILSIFTEMSVQCH